MKISVGCAAANAVTLLKMLEMQDWRSVQTDCSLAGINDLLLGIIHDFHALEARLPFDLQLPEPAVDGIDDEFDLLSRRQA